MFIPVPYGGSANGSQTQTGTATTVLSNGTSIQSAVYTPTSPSYDYIAGNGQLTNAPGTAPPYVNSSGNVNPLYAGSPPATSAGATTTAAATATTSMSAYWPILAVGVIAAILYVERDSL